MNQSVEINQAMQLVSDVQHQVAELIQEATADSDSFLLESLRQALQADYSNFKLARFPAVIEVVVRQCEKELKAKALTRQSQFKGCIKAFFEVNPVTNQALVVKYNLNNSPPTAHIYSDHAILCDALAHGILQGGCVKLSGDDLREAVEAVAGEGWLESCAEERKAALCKISAIQTARSELLPLLGVESADDIPQYLSKVRCSS